MRRKDSGQGCAGDLPGPGPGDPPAIIPAPPSAASPAPEPSAEPEPVSGQAPAAGQEAGSGSRSVSGPPAGACPASEAGSEAGSQRPSSFSAVQGNAQPVPSNCDTPRTRFIVPGPFGPRATALATGQAAYIWKTPAAPKRVALIRELEEASRPDRPLSVKKITQEDIKVMLNLLEERERDLSAAARIGQSLVKQNSVLVEKNSKLETMLGAAREEILHLRHQVSLRDDLLQLYSDSDDEEEEEEEEREEGEEEEEEEEEEKEQQHDHPHEAPEQTPLTQPELLHHCPQLKALQEQLRLLEEENAQLREEASQLDTLEEEEQMLILECVEQFSEASQQMAELSEVLVLRMENYDQQQKEVTQLRTQVTNLQHRCQLYGAETAKLQRQLALEKEIQLQLQDELQDLWEKYMEGEGLLPEDREDAETRYRHAPGTTGTVTHYTYTVPLEAIPDFQESLAKELRKAMKNIISDPIFFVERYEMQSDEDQEQEEGSESEEGSLLAEDFMPGEERGATEEAAPAEGGATEEAEEAEAWEEVEPELDEAAPTNATSAPEARSSGPSNLDMKYVLQQLANWQDANYRRRLRQRMFQKGSPTLQQWQQQAKTNMGGGIEEQQPRLRTQDFRRLEEDRANHPPMAWEEEGPSGATQATGTKGRSRTGPLGFAVFQQPAEAPQTA
uniref:Huntingtin associated protein 1 n=2 Tax=Molossus molossus TaxID=27622 RepID=A0A7J8CY67_MOLMO|nr:huntingtin associated protein 1 [Molossus molossus]